jgi:molybdenum cofactor cytidylyltransferase
MGSPKALLRVGPDTFLYRVLRTLEAAGIDDVVVVTGAHDRAIRDAFAGQPLSAGVRIVFNPAHEQGQLASLVAGLDALAPHHPDAVLVALVDQPLVRAETIVALVEALHREPAAIVRPAYQGRHGHPVLFARETFDALRAAPLEEGARAVVHAWRDRVFHVPVDDAGVVDDIDTPADYIRVVKESG